MVSIVSYIEARDAIIPDGTETLLVLKSSAGKRVTINDVRTAPVFYVDAASGSDSNAGTLASPFATMSKAFSVATSGSTILLRRASVHRSTSPISVSSLDGLKVGSYAKSGDTLPRALVRFSTSVAAASWTSAAPTYTNLYYTTVDSDPAGVWEVDASGNITRMYYNAKGPTTPVPNAPDAATADGQAGAFYYDSGATRLYQYPWGGSITGKSYEIPMAATGITFTYCTNLELSDIDFGFSRDEPVHVTSCTGRSINCKFGQCANKAGQGNGLEIGIYSNWTDIGSTFYDSGNDGAGMGAGTAVAQFYGSKFQDNRGDGVSFDAANVTGVLSNCTATGNGKDGAVKISSGSLRIDGGRYYNNGSEDIYAVLSTSVTVTMELANVQADRLAIDAGASGTITAKVVSHRGPVTVSGAGSTVTVEGLRVKGDGTGTGKMQYGFRCNAGSLTVTDFWVGRMGYTFMLTGGTLTVKGGHGLRGSSAPLYISGGTLTVDANDPINLWSGSAFSAWGSGVSYGLPVSSGLAYSVTNGGNAYICTTAHTSGGAFDGSKFAQVQNFNAV